MSPDDSRLLLVASCFKIEELERSASKWDKEAKRAESPECREDAEQSAARCRRAIQLLKEYV